VEVFGRELRALAVFGSSVYSSRYGDADLLVVVDRLGSAREKLEVRIGESLRDLPLGRYFDVPSLEENAAPGGFLSGLVLGCRVICDEVGLGELARLDTYEVRKGGRRVDLSAVARTVLTSPSYRSTGARCGE